MSIFGRRLVAAFALVASLFACGTFAASADVGAPTTATTPAATPAPPAYAIMGGAPRAGVAPRLEMRDYVASARAGPGSVSLRLAFQTKTLGLVWWKNAKVYALPDTAYSRWAAAQYADYYFLRAKRWLLDPAVDRCCTRVGTSDFDGNVSIAGLPVGRYVIFGGYFTESGTPRNTFTTYEALDADGNPARASIPDVTFVDSQQETVYFLAPFEITAATPVAKIVPTADVDVLSK